MKAIVLLTSLFLLIGCAEASSSTGNPIDVHAQATFSAQTVVAARSSGNTAGVFAVQTDIAKTEVASKQSTANAQERFRVSVTQTAEANQTRGAAEENTITANENATAWSRNATSAVQTPTARAIATATAIAESIATQTAVVVLQNAHVEQTRQAENLKDEIAAQEERRAIQAATLDARTQASYWSEAIGVLWMPVTGALFVLIVLYWITRMFGALHNRLQAESVARLPPPIPTFEQGVLVGYFMAHKGQYIWQDVREYIDQSNETKSIPAVIPTTFASDIKRVSEPDPDVLYGFIRRSALEVFVKTILETGDWSQKTWADKPLSGGFVMSKDTKDASGIIVYGGYSRVMQLFTDKQLIIGRGQGATGKWNPNAPATVGEVMAVLYNEVPMPSLPPEPEKRQEPMRPRRRRAAPTLSGASAE